MKCRKYEKLLLRSLDGLLENRTDLDDHLKNCRSCRTKRDEYIKMLDLLKKEDFPEAKPYFWERLQPKLKEKVKVDPGTLWKQWGIRAIPLSILIVALFGAAIIFFSPAQTVELSDSEALLLPDENPFQDTISLLEEGESKNPNITLIFTAIDERNGTRRYFP
jgi:hypothetical protein